MNITWTYEIINKSREGDDHIVTGVTVQFDGDITDNVTIFIHHYRPTSKDDVLTGIENRIITERDRIVSRNAMDKILSEL